MQDINKTQRFRNSGQYCTACNQCPSEKDKTHREMRETTASATDLSTTRSIVLMDKYDKSRRKKTSATDYLGEIRDVERQTLSWNIPPLQSSKQRISSLFSHNTYLQQVNAAILKKIIDMEDHNIKSANNQLKQYNMAENNVQALQAWTARQTQDGQHDLNAMRVHRENHIKDLRIQLQACEKKIHEAQENLTRLRDYRDREHSMKVLQFKGLERQLRFLNETHEDQAADVAALTNNEITKLFDSAQTVNKGILQNVVKEQLECAPLTLKRLCHQNQKLKQDILTYQQMIAETKKDILVLLEKGHSLSKSWNKETDKLCSDLLLDKPICTPDEDVILNIPFNKQMPI